MGEGNHEIEKIIKEQDNLKELHLQMYENLKIMLENQKYKAENETLVINNQRNIIKNQETIVNNQVNIISNQKLIVENQISLSVMLKLQEMIINKLSKLDGNEISEIDVHTLINNLKENLRSEIHTERIQSPETI